MPAPRDPPCEPETSAPAHTAWQSSADKKSAAAWHTAGEQESATQEKSGPESSAPESPDPWHGRSGEQTDSAWHTQNPRAQSSLSKEFKALLLNGLLCPGAGHWYLGQKVAAMLMLGIALLSLSLMLGDIVALAKTLATEMIQSGQLANGLAGDPAALLQLVRERSAELERAEWSFYLLLGVWLVAVGDCLRLLFSHPRRG